MFKKNIKFVTVVLFSLFIVLYNVPLSISADEPPPIPYAYNFVTDNGEYVFYMTPLNPYQDDKLAPTNLPSGLYTNTTPREPMYLLSNDYLYDSEIYMSADGMSFAVCDYWAGLGIGERGDHSVAISFYSSGKLVKEYRVSDLVNNMRKCVVSVSHVQWDFQSERSFSSISGTLLVKTRDGIYYLFDIMTGEILKQGDQLENLNPERTNLMVDDSLKVTIQNSITSNEPLILYNTDYATKEELDKIVGLSGNTIDYICIDMINPIHPIVDMRIGFNPGDVSDQISLSGHIGLDDLQKERLEELRYGFKNSCYYITLDQQEFEKPVQIAVISKISRLSFIFDPDMSDWFDNEYYSSQTMEIREIVFYHYEEDSQLLTKMNDVNYWLDSVGYLHFTTKTGGLIMISSGELEPSWSNNGTIKIA